MVVVDVGRYAAPQVAASRAWRSVHVHVSNSRGQYSAVHVPHVQFYLVPSACTPPHSANGANSCKEKGSPFLSFSFGESASREGGGQRGRREEMERVK